jgi:hypothetical protein
MLFWRDLRARQADQACGMQRSNNTILYVFFAPGVAKKRQRALESAGLDVVMIA